MKVHTEERSVGELRVNLGGCLDYGLLFSLGAGPEDVISKCLVSSQLAGSPVTHSFFLSYLVFPELSWCQVHNGSYSICNADDIIIIL